MDRKVWTRHGVAVVVSLVVATGGGSAAAMDRGGEPSSRTRSTVADAPAPIPVDSIRVDGGARFTDDRSITIGVGPASDARVIDGVRLRNRVEGEPEDWVDATSLDGIAWALGSGPDGQRTVEAQVHYGGGDWSDVMSDAIILDTTAPDASFEIINKFGAAGEPWSAHGLGVEEPLLRVLVRDASFGAGGDVARIAIRVNDLPLRERDPDNSTRVRDGDLITYTDMYSDLYRDYDYPRGTITVKAKWRDEAGNWSDVVSDSYEMLHYEPVATLFVDGTRVPADLPDGPMPPPPATNSATNIELRVRIDHLPIGPDGETGTVEAMWISGDHDGPYRKLTWGDGASRSVDWSLIDTRYGYATTDGIKDVYIRLRPSIGRERSLRFRVILDRVTPTSDEPVTAVAIGSVVGSSGEATAAATTSIKGMVTWKGSDRSSKGKSGVGSYTLQRSVNRGSWKSQSLTKRTDRKAVSVLSASDGYRFRVRTTDRAGNRSSWKSGAELRPSIVSEGSSKIRYTGKWTSRSRSDALGGKLRTTTTKGGSASLTFRGTGIAWVAPRSPDGDSVDVYIDGRKVKTAHLVASTYQPRRVVFSTAWTKAGTHTIRIVHRYPEHALPLDAFIVLR